MKFLVVGLGSMGKRRVRNLQFLKAGEIIGFDPREDRRAEASTKYGIAVFGDFDQAMAQNPDALVISTPPDLHTRYALAAANNNKHFFTEASVVDDGMDELMALCAKKNVVAAPSCTMRFHHSVRLIRDLIHDGAIGPILSYTYHSGQYLPDWHPWEDYRTFYVAKRETGGCREIVPFELSWMLWALGDVEAVKCFKGKLTTLEIDIDDVYQMLMRHTNGTLGHVQVDVVARVPYRIGRFLSERGVIEWNWADHIVRVYDSATGKWTEHEEPKGTVETGYLAAEDMYREEMRAFIAAIRGEQPWGYTLADDKNILALLQAAERDSDQTPESKREEEWMSVTGQELYRKARRRIPGGTQLLSKRPEMYLPENWPSYYQRVKGVEVWDISGNRYIDMAYSGIGACVLGAGDPDVDAAVLEAIRVGSMSTLNCPEEVELADLLCELHPWAEMVRFGRCGGEAMAIAVRIARARTGRDKIAFCGYHGWHDWYLAANLSDGEVLDAHLLPGLEPAGVPRALAGTALPFHYNQIEELEKIVSKHGADLAAVVMEPVRNHDPAPGFLEAVREIAHKAGAVLIFDEVTSGFRMNTGGIHMLYGVSPDMAVFAKGMSNGYPMAAIIGVADVMQAAQTSFISSTYWTERIGPTAALATIRKHRDRDVSSHLVRIGAAVQKGWADAAENAGLSVSVSGIAPLGHFSFNYPDGQAMRTLFTQLMLGKGFLTTGGFYATYAHQPEHVSAYLDAVNETFTAIAAARNAGTVVSSLNGPIAHSGFQRLN